MANMVFEHSGRLVVMIHKAADPTADEWNQFMATFKTLDFSSVRQLVFTDGGGPDSAQRRMINDILNGQTTTVAVVTHQTAVRGIVTALSWFNKKIKAFAPTEAHAALKHLGVEAPVEIELAWKIVHRLKKKLGDESLKSMVAIPPAA